MSVLSSATLSVAAPAPPHTQDPDAVQPPASGAGEAMLEYPTASDDYMIKAPEAASPNLSLSAAQLSNDYPTETGSSESTFDVLTAPDPDSSSEYPGASEEHNPESFRCCDAIKTEPEDFEAFETSVYVERVKSEMEQLYPKHEIMDDIVIGPTEVAQVIRPEPSTESHSFVLDVEHLYGSRVVLQNVDKLRCRWCGEWSTSSTALQIHNQIHLHHVQDQPGHSQDPSVTELKHQCKHCDKVCKTQWHLLKHLSTHRGPKVHKLGVKNNVTLKERSKNTSYVIDANRKDRIKIININKLKQFLVKPNMLFKCDMCHKKFDDKYSLLNHIKIHIFDTTENVDSVQDVGNVYLPDENYISIQDVDDAPLQDKDDSPLQNKNVAAIQDKDDAPIHDKNNAPIQNVDDTFVQNEDDTPIQGKENTAILDDDNTAILDDDNTAILDDDNTAILDDDNTAILDDENTTILDDDNTSSQHVNDDSIQNEEVNTRIRSKVNDFYPNLYAKTYPRERKSFKRKLLRHSKKNTREPEVVLEHECKQCDMKCSSNLNLVKHIKARHENIKPPKLYSCVQCDTKFRYKSYLARHLLSHFLNQQNCQCNKCSKQFTAKSSLKIHSISNRCQISHLTCDICKTTLKNKAILIKHIKNHTLQNNQCNKCSRNFANKSNLKKHQVTYNCIERYTCDICKVRFKHKFSLIKHLKNHPSKRQINQCNKCSKHFSTKSNLKKHQKFIQCKIKRYTCDICEHKFDCILSLKRHLILHNLDVTDVQAETENETQEYESTNYQRPNQYKCIQCNKLCKSNRHLTKHQTTHEDDKKDFESNEDEKDSRSFPPSPPQSSTSRNEHKCEYCNKTCKSNWHLLKHQSTHSKEGTNDKTGIIKSVKDEVLDFNPRLSSSELQHHNLMRNDDGSFGPDTHLADDNDDKAAKELIEADSDVPITVKSSPSTLKILPSRKEFKCAQCHKSCSSNWHLLKHQTTHTELKLFKCDICNERISGKIEFQNHVKNHSVRFQMLNKSLLLANNSDVKLGSSFVKLVSSDVKLRSSYVKLVSSDVKLASKLYPCDHCDLKFIYATCQTKHQLRRHFICDICSKQFNRKIALVRHLKNHHTTEEAKKVSNVQSKITHSKTRNSKPNIKHEYYCNQCDEVFECKKKLRLHEKNHKTLKTYECALCDMKTLKKYDYTRHKKTHEVTTQTRLGRKKIPCDLCAITFTYDSSLARHRIKTHGRIDNIACDVCNKIFTRKLSLRRHLYEVHKDVKRYFCNVEKCDKRFDRKHKLSIHQNDHFKELGESLSCNICLKTFENKFSCARHKSMHNRTGYSCDICKKLFTYKDSVAKHMILHMAVKRFACHICNKRFYYRTNLNSHMAYHSGVKRYTCDICDKRYTDKSGVRKHIIYFHNKKTPLVCELCNISFERINNYDKHKLSHENVKMHTCHLCGMSFVHQLVFTKHLATHNIDPFQCNSCGRKCKSSLELNRHYTSIHSKFTCDICAQSFTLRDALVKHILTHNGFTKYPCGVCDKTFKENIDLTKHLQEHMPIKTVTCEDCNETFNYSNSMLNHLCKRETFGHVCEICGQKLKNEHDLANHLLIHCVES